MPLIGVIRRPVESTLMSINILLKVLLVQSLREYFSDCDKSNKFAVIHVETMPIDIRNGAMFNALHGG